MSTSINRADYITLTEAAKHSPYTQEYLSLRARQGKLRAVKRGRNWMTTLGWLEDYTQQTETAKAQLKEAPVVLAASPALTPSDYEPASHVSTGEESESFVEHTPKLAMHSFSWEEAEEAAALSAPDEQWFSELRDRVDAAYKEQPVIEHYQEEAPAHLSRQGAAETYSVGDVALGSSAVQAAYTEMDEKEERQRQSMTGQIVSFMQPVMAVCAVVVVSVGLIAFDGLFQVRQNVAIGAGVVLSDIGSGIENIGYSRQEAKIAKQEVQPPSVARTSTSIFSVDASSGYNTGYSADYSTGYGSYGQVAGTQKDEPLGFWATVWLGALTVIGL